jgi:hypothetical protein
MRAEHEAVQEVLAAHALHSLDDGDLERMESILRSHLPECLECRTAFESFQVVSGDLALAASAHKAPALLHARIHRETRPRRSATLTAVAAYVAALALLGGLAFWSLHLTSRVTQAESRQAKTTEVLAAVSHPLSHIVSLAPEGETPDSIQLAATYVPGRSALYLFGSMPQPRPHRVYQVWLVRSGRFSSAATFVPDRGQVLLRIKVNPAPYDGLLITEERSEGGHAPSDQRVVSASL